MKTFVVFQALDDEALECLVDWRKSRTLDPAAFVRQRYGLVYHLTLPYAWQTSPPLERDMIAVDLETMTVTTPFQDRFGFELDPFRRKCLIEGLDEIGMTLAQGDAIDGYEAQVATARPWLNAAA